MKCKLDWNLGTNSIPKRTVSTCMAVVKFNVYYQSRRVEILTALWHERLFTKHHTMCDHESTSDCTQLRKYRLPYTYTIIIWFLETVLINYICTCIIICITHTYYMYYTELFIMSRRNLELLHTDSTSNDKLFIQTVQ